MMRHKDLCGNWTSEGRDRYFRSLNRKFGNIIKNEKEDFFLNVNGIEDVIPVPYTNHTYNRKTFKKYMDVIKYHKNKVFEKNAYYFIIFELLDDSFNYQDTYKLPFDLKDHFTGYFWLYVNTNNKFDKSYGLMTADFCGSHNIKDIEKDFNDMYDMIIESCCFEEKNIEFYNFGLGERTGNIIDEMFLRNPQFRICNKIEVIN